ERPWTVKVFVLSIPLSWLPLLLDRFSLSDRNNLWNAALGVVLLAGVWMRNRLAWIVLLAFVSLSFAALLVSAAPGAEVILAFPAIWTGLLVAAPTSRWINRGRSVPVGSGAT
ncbi:MAG TPA: hypothetical protein VHI71_07265, partial [Actinomycetota bacterium]|nr:hypothetical protein [Actinomycetota bacterium]